MLFRQIEDPRLAQYAYLVGCPRSGEALLIDPERDVDRYLAVAEEEGLTITAVAETHIHADFLSGARELAERIGARLYLSDEGTQEWKYEWAGDPRYDVTLLRDGDVFTVGNVEIRVLHTPGHTPEHLAFLIVDRGSGATQPMGIVSGDFVFVGDVGRPDLLETAARVAGAMVPAARQLHASLRGFLELPDFLQVWPGHGAGSACGKALGDVPESTVGYERRFNPALAVAREGEEAFLEYVLEGQPEPPLYFARMKRDNRLGVPLLGELPSPRRLADDELGALAGRSDVAVLDTRGSRPAFLARHLPGSLHAPLKRSFPTVVGSLVSDERIPIHLIARADDVETAVRALLRIGYDRVLGYAEPETLEALFAAGGPVATIESIGFGELEPLRRRDGVAVVDVRFGQEYKEGHLPGSLLAPYTRLPELEPELPDATLAVHCASGARAGAAAAFLARRGRRVVHVEGSFAEAASLLPGPRGGAVPAG